MKESRTFVVTCEGPVSISQGPASGDHVNSIIVTGENLEVSDGYHTMHELYQHRMYLNIALFSILDQIYPSYKNARVVKSRKHFDGSMFPGYFIVMAITPSGQISYHYDLKHWSKFDIQEVDKTPEWDGHGSLEVFERLLRL